MLISVDWVPPYDHDSGGFVVVEIEQNIRICLAEKAARVATIRGKYPEWWLALVDRIGYGVLHDFDRESLRELLHSDDRWDKVIPVNPLDPARGFEV